MHETTAAPTRFHLSLNVTNLPRSIQFFQQVLGVAPAKCRADYAKFEPESPPLVLSLEPHPHSGGGALNHAGFRFPDSASLVAAQRRLEEAGMPTQREEGVECCYARQTKFWAHDPDNNLWEFYVLEGDIDHRGAGQALEVITAVPVDPSAPKSWEHRMGQPLQIPADFAAESFDEVRLRGSFNVPTSADDTLRFLKEVATVIRPGGELHLHILTAESPLSSAPQLPGGAAFVKHVPVREALLDAVAAAGFIDLQLTTFRSKACFEHEGIALRETKIACRRPVIDTHDLCAVVYKGPFAEVTDDEGHTWRRGRKTAIPLSRWESLQRSPIAELFVQVPAEVTVGACGG